MTEVLNDLDLKIDLNFVECLHLPITFFIQGGVGAIVNVSG